jgi:cysteinyl-tRNA synthetase
MSKSLGNVVLVHDLLDEAPGEVVRLALLNAHYRQPLDWSDDVLVEARRKLDRLYNALRKVSGWESDWAEATPSLEFTEALEDDINTPRALAALFALAREINRLGADPEAVPLARQLRASADVLGLLGSDPVAWFEAGATQDADGAEIDALLAQRTAARLAGDYAEADRIRDQLTDMGIVIEDSSDGPRWRRVGA